MEKTVVEFDVKHPIILPQKCHFSQLVIRQYHVEIGHSGTSHTWASVREKFWIVKGGSAIRHVIGQCIACRKRNSKVGQQFMADLPSCRLQSFERLFYNTGIDYFGPFMIKQGRSLVKRYGCVFTCLTMRAVHIEIANSLTADSFINALRRFTARRGKPNCIFSDNGTNFVGAGRILRESLEELNKGRIDRYCCQQNIKWVFMPPSASHMGGAWERMIRSIRKILNALIGCQTLNDEGLVTFMTKVEAILNSRLLVPVIYDDKGQEPLTSNHLLLFKGNINLPPGVFDKKHCYTRKRWAQIQYMSNQFWCRWIKEFLPNLSQRQKWFQKNRNLQLNDIVLIVEDMQERSKWVLGRVVKTFPDKSGVVRTVSVKTPSSVITRPITKLCLILEFDKETGNKLE